LGRIGDLTSIYNTVSMRNGITSFEQKNYEWNFGTQPLRNVRTSCTADASKDSIRLKFRKCPHSPVSLQASYWTGQLLLYLRDCLCSVVSNKKLQYGCRMEFKCNVGRMVVVHLVFTWREWRNPMRNRRRHSRFETGSRSKSIFNTKHNCRPEHVELLIIYIVTLFDTALTSSGIKCSRL